MAKSRQHMLDRIERIDKPLMYSKPPKIKLEYDIEPTKDIVRVVDCPLVVGEGADKKELIKSLTMNVRRGEHVAIIGERYRKNFHTETYPRHYPTRGWEYKLGRKREDILF